MRFLRASSQRITRRGTLRGLTLVPPSLRPPIPSPTLALRPSVSPSPRAHGTRRTRSGADARRPLRDPSTVETGRGETLVRDDTRAPTATANAARPDSHPRSGTLRKARAAGRVIVRSLLLLCPGGGGRRRDRFRGRNNRAAGFDCREMFLVLQSCRHTAEAESVAPRW